MESEINPENLVVYKLGQIESHLTAIQVRMADQDAQYRKDFTQLENKFDLHAAAQNKQEKRIDRLEENWNMVRNWLVGGGFVISAIYFLAKVIFPWLK